MSTRLVDKTTGADTYVEDADVPDALASGKYIAPAAVAVHRFGQDTYASPEVAERERQLAPTIAPEKAELARGHAIREQRNAGIAGTAAGAIGGAVNSLTAGLVNPYEEAQEFHSTAADIGGFVGAVAPALIGDEAGLASLLEPANTERAAGALSSRMLYSGEVGAEAGTVGRSIEQGLARGGGELEAAGKLAAVPQDLAGMDAAGLRDARGAEVQRLVDDQAGRRGGNVDDLKAYRAQVDDANPWLVIDEGEPAAQLKKSNNALRNAMNDPRGLAENPAPLLKPLRVQEQALQAALEDAPAISERFAKVNAKLADGLEEELSTLPDAATDVELSGKLARRYGTFADVKVGKAARVTIARDDASAFLDALKTGKVQGEGQAAMGKLSGLLESNRSLQKKIESNLLAKGDLSSERLRAIDSASDALGHPKAKSLAEDMLGGSIMGHVAGALSGLPIVGPMIGAKAGRLASDLVFGKLGEAAGEASTKAAAAVQRVVGAATSPAAAIPAASAVLRRVSFGAGAEPAKGAELAELYRHRTDQIKALTMYDATGATVMRPEARQALGDRFAALRQKSPVLADRLETIAARRIEYLSSQIPRRPDLGMPIAGPDGWQPSHMQMAEFARKVHAVEDPASVEARIADGSLTPEDVAAYRAVYPERAAKLERDLFAEMSKLEKPLPYERRISLSMFTGRPLDPSLDPRVLGLLQSQFANEEGTEGGSRAPVPKPAFGSVRADLATPSQERESAMR